MEGLYQDFRYGLRIMFRKPAFTAIAVLTLALGIGANTAIFSIVNAVLLRQLPYPESNRLVMLWSTMQAQGVSNSGSSLPDYREWRDQNHVFEGLAGFYYGDFNLSGMNQEPERVQGGRVTANLFQVLGVAPAMGRNFLPEEEQFGRHHVVLLSYELWQRRYSSDSSIVGRTISLGGDPYTVVGVMPKGMAFFDNQPRVDLWTPISFAHGDNMDSRNNYFVNLVGRLKPGVTLQQAQAEVSAIAGRIQNSSGESSGLGGLVVPLHEQLVGDVRTALLVLLGAVAFVLLVACVNVANLLLARASAREKELAIRASLGASRARIIRQLAIESLPLGLIGGAAGLLMAVWGIDVLASLLPASLPRHNPITVDARVLGFTLLISLLTALIFGLLPAFQVAKVDVQNALAEGGRSGTQSRRQGRLRGLLIASEMALALILLVGAGLMIESFIKLSRVDAGFNAQNVLTMRIPLPASKYPTPKSIDDPPPAAINFYDRLLEKIKALPGVQSAGVSTSLPLGVGNQWGKLFSVEGHPAVSMDQVPLVSFALVSPEYLRTMAINVRRGRSFNERDTENAQPVAIINETAARRFFPGEEPLGKTVWLGPPENLLPPEALKEVGRFERRMVVGVVADVKGSSLDQSSQAQVYAPYYQNRKEGWSNGLMLAVRTGSAPENLVAAIRKQVYALDPDQPVSDVATMEERLNTSLSQPRFSALLLGLFAAVALLLAAVGIYGVMSYLVTQRTHEIGIRMALGASTRDILKLVVGHGMGLTLIGVGCGLIAAFLLTRFLTSLLFEVSSFDPVTYGVVSLLLIIVALLACYIPARRATRVDPMVALRYE